VLFWMQIARWFQKCTIFCCIEVNCKCNRFKLIKIWQNLKIPYILTLFDLKWLKLTFKQQNMFYFGINEQFTTRKRTISISRATSNFDLRMRIFNLQGIGAPDRPKKKVRRHVSYMFLQLFKVQARSISTKL
jgi:hypothetical protein